MASYIVSGAGTSDYNGTYVDTGTTDATYGQPVYKLDDSHWLYFGGVWVLTSFSPGTAQGYAYTGTTIDGTWVIWAGGGVYAGVDPVPTVTLAEDGGGGSPSTGNMFLML